MHPFMADLRKEAEKSLRRWKALIQRERKDETETNAEANSLLLGIEQGYLVMMLLCLALGGYRFLPFFFDWLYFVSSVFSKKNRNPTDVGLLIIYLTLYGYITSLVELRCGRALLARRGDHSYEMK